MSSYTPPKAPGAPECVQAISNGTSAGSICLPAHHSVAVHTKRSSSKKSRISAAIKGISGVTTLILAVPLGILVDHCNRIKLMRVGVILGVIAAFISAYAFSFDNLATLYMNLFLWGIFSATQATAAEAIFADSLEKGQRSRAFTMKGMLNTCGLSLGPLLMLGMFLGLGNEWVLKDLHLPLFVGCCFAPVACIPLAMLRDPKPGVDLSQPSTICSSLRTPLLTGPSRITPILAPATPLRRDRISSTFSDYSEFKLPPALSEGMTEEERLKNATPRERWIPYIISLSDFVTEIGAGMTPLCNFLCVSAMCFDVSLHLSRLERDHRKSKSVTVLQPHHVQVQSVVVFRAMPICQRLSVGIGRAQASFIFQCCGVALLLLMTYVKYLPFLIVIFMLRGQFQNGAYPVDRSILMDYVPSKHRGKWNSVMSLATMTWSGSAVLGGYLADGHDYRYTFLITAFVYTLGVVAYSPLLWLVPRDEAAEVVTPPRGRNPDAIPETKETEDNTASTALLSPLLSPTESLSPVTNNL